ncbi:hypothetical protein IJG71_01935 [Candidatus Saccharibacteria bacterium]|nr:hypothetical protein [Candidatus Saccharibacteria bacterium]
MKIKQLLTKIFATIILAISCLGFSVQKASALENLFTITPMSQRLSLIPGERTYGTFKVSSPSSSTASFVYKIRVEPFRLSEENTVIFENNGDYNQIVNWITLEETEGIVAPNSTNEIKFYIDVPKDAPAGGQYASIIVGSKDTGEEDKNVTIKTNLEMAHTIYAEVAGETVRKGEINDVNVPGFIFSGNITGSAKISNLGNVHSESTHILQIFPLFSNEEIYTNEENPEVKFFMPEATRVTTVSWDQTPSIGIFHVIYNVEFEGVNQKVDKMVIVCPLWLLFIIAVIIFLIIFKILSGKKENK